MTDLRPLVESYLEDRWQRDPVSATSVGIHRYDHQLGDYDPASVEEGHRRRQDFLTAFRSLDTSHFSPGERLDYRLAVSELETDIEMHSLRWWERAPAVYADLAITGIYLLTVREFAPLAERMAAAGGRLRAIAPFLAVAQANLKDTTPPIFAEIGLQIAEGGLFFLEEVIPQLAQRLGKEDPAAEGSLLDANALAQRALRDYTGFVRDLRQRARGEFAIGRPRFDFLLRHNHMLSLDSDGLYALGERIFAQTQKQLEELAEQIRPGTPWVDLVSASKHDHPSPEDLVSAYRREMERARQFTLERDLASLAQGEVLEVVETPTFLRSIMPYAAYDPPPAFDPDGRGLFYVTPVSTDGPAEVREQQLEGHNYYSLPITALHEGYPGHHLQLTRAKLVDSPLRRQGQSSLFAEGWALYCEEMMHEVGFYADPRVRLFQLKDALWRASRVLVDVGLHTRGMTIEQAVDFMVDRVKLERPHAEAEVRRYTMTPTQPMSYLMGRELILDLRRQLKARQGEGFRLKEFHDRLLSFGTLPTPLVAEEMLL